MRWIRGHSGDVFNERADSLANAEARKAADEENLESRRRDGSSSFSLSEEDP